MRKVTICVEATHEATETYRRISDFGRYPDFTETVREVVVHPADADGSVVSEWTVNFRNGLLCWTERDVLDRERMAITFTQLTGDFETFNGVWTVEPHTEGSRVTFEAEFDLGIPSLAAIVDPVAEATLRSNILLILQGLLGEVTPVEMAAACD